MLILNEENDYFITTKLRITYLILSLNVSSQNICTLLLLNMQRTINNLNEIDNILTIEYQVY